MPEKLVNLTILAGKENKYKTALEQARGLLQDENDLIANMANISALLHHGFGFWWTGFYLVKGDELVLGPFQGPVACTRIAFGRGVCGTAWKEKRTIVVENVHEFPGHIACSEASNSEIVVPLLVEDNVVAVLDVDSEQLAHFDKVDAEFLEKIVKLLC